VSTLTLVRHGQATPFQEISDRLSPLGQEQARALGAFWIREGRGFDEVSTGSLVRQRRTAETVGEVYAAAGMPWPTPQVRPEWNEYNVEAILRHLAPQVERASPRFARLMEAHRAHRDGPEQNRHFQRMLEALMQAWVDADVTHAEVEPWRAFRDRVQGALREILAQPGNGRRVAVFTSGGPIAASVQAALGMPDPNTLELNWRVRNGSMTELVFTAGRLTLDCFNAVPHLDAPRLRSWR